MSLEEYIARRCQKGDSDAQRQLYETYAGWLLGVCLRYVGQRSVAEDLLQDGFIKILTNIKHFRWQGEGSLRAWLFKVERNVIIQYLRSKGNELLSIDEKMQEIMEVQEPENINGVPLDVLMQMIGELPFGYRTVFNLYIIDGHSHREIAQLLGIKERSSASQLFHARRMMANKINSWKKENL